MHFQFRPALAAQALPVVFRRDADVAVVGGLAVLVGHFQEDEVGELLQVVAVAHAVVAQGVAEAPDFGDDAGGPGPNALCTSMAALITLLLSALIFDSVIVFTHRLDLP
jgi:hypothetical protein